MSIATFTHAAISDIEAGFHAILHKLGMDHGIPEADILAAKAAGSALLPTLEAVAEPIVEKVIEAEAPAALVPVAEELVHVAETEASAVLAPEAAPVEALAETPAAQ